ncbi:MAG: Ig-like domain-containing protein [Bacteroidales bacterium]
MRKIFTLMISAMFVAGVFAQRPEGVIMKASVSPVIDAEVDEVWAEANIYPIDKPFQSEVPTVEGTTWKALWDEFGIYVLVECLDDQWWPNYLGDGGADYLFDKPEIYFDVNVVLDDGGGASGANGHYQLAPGPTEGQTDGTPLSATFQGGAAAATYSITVKEPNANYEYFIPMDALTNGDGLDVTSTIGFDVTMIDRDEGDATRKRAVWANIGEITESWVNMDDCGYVTFDGAEIEVYVESVSIEDAVIDENNGTVQIIATVLPENADIRDVKWSVENGTGKATIDKDGVVTGLLDGTVTVTALAKDGSWMEDQCTVTISNQIVTAADINIIRNGFFKQVNDDGTAAEWSGARQVVDGAMFIPAALKENPDWWLESTSNQSGFGLNATDSYTFSFVAWSEASDTLYVDFEDAREAVGYNRFGTSAHEFSAGLSDGSADYQSQWEFETNTEATYYLIDENLIFNEWEEASSEVFNIMGGLHQAGGIFIDEIVLYNNNDKDLLTPDYIPVTEVVVSGGSQVAVDATLQMAAAVTPGDATLTDVRWSVVNGTGEATIDASGLLTGVSVGVVTVVATAKDDSGVTGVIDVTVGVTGISQKSVNALKVYPNPAVNELNVVLNSENTTVSIYNGVGQKMDEAVVSGSEYKFDISSYAAGIYFVKTQTSIAKFVK